MLPRKGSLTNIVGRQGICCRHCWVNPVNPTDTLQVHLLSGRCRARRCSSYAGPMSALRSLNTSDLSVQRTNDDAQVSKL